MISDNPVIRIFERIKQSDRASFWLASSLAQIHADSNLDAIRHASGTLSVLCKVCNCCEDWPAAQWMDDTVLIHHNADCLLMKPVVSEVVQ